jgi:glycosyltransferase involved in cell wall biosynthesis
MYRGQTVGVVLPAYNEADHIGAVIESLPAFVDRVYAIDDCSTDDTFDVISSYATETDHSGGAVEPADDSTRQRILPDGHGRTYPPVIPVQHRENQGAGGTLKTGYLLSTRDGMDNTVTIDADGQMDPDRMASLLDPLVEGRAGFSKGNRLADPTTANGMPRLRLLGNWLLTLLMKPASGYWKLRDPQNGYTAISLDALEAVDITAIPDDHDYPNDLLTRLNTAGVTVADVPMPAIYGDEESTIQFSEFVRQTSGTILTAFYWRLKTVSGHGGRHLPLFYAAGVVGLAVGLLSALGTALSGLLPESLSYTLSESAAFLGLGGLSLGLAMAADRQADAEVIRE